MYHEVYIGDYSIMVWVRDGETLKDAIKEEINRSIAHLGLKVVSV